MVSHQPGKFGDHSCCGSEDMTYLVVEGQDSTRSLSLKFAITVYLCLKHMP